MTQDCPGRGRVCSQLLLKSLQPLGDGRVEASMLLGERGIEKSTDLPRFTQVHWRQNRGLRDIIFGELHYCFYINAMLLCIIYRRWGLFTWNNQKIRSHPWLPGIRLALSICREGLGLYWRQSSLCGQAWRVGSEISWGEGLVACFILPLNMWGLIPAKKVGKKGTEILAANIC